jgi:hypothetical protein
MKIKLLLFCASIFAVSGSINGMMRFGRMPIRKPIAIQNYSEVAHIQSQYSLPKASPATQTIAELTREQLAVHLKHQEHCWKVYKNSQACMEAKRELMNQVVQLTKSSLKLIIAGAAINNRNFDVGPMLLGLALDEFKLSYKVARAAVREYKENQAREVGGAQALMKLVAEQKRQLPIPEDIQ